MKVKSITSFGESVVFHMENGETYSMAEIEKHIAEMRKPQVKVGDWVLQSYAAHLQRQVKIVEIAGEKFRARIQGLLLNSWFDMDSIIRKIDNSEVKVSITMEGTVEKVEGTGCFLLNVGNEGIAYCLDYASLTPSQAEMVRELTGGGE